MKLWKKAAGAAVCLSVLAASFAGCAGSTPDSATDLQIHFWRSGYGDEFIEQIVEDFEDEYPQYNVILDITADNSIIGTTLELGGDFNPVDLYMSVTPSVKLRREFAEPLDDILDDILPGESQSIGQKYNQDFLDYMMVEGTDGEEHCYTLSYGGGWYGIVYNADIIDGVNYEVPLTTDELEILAVELEADDYTPFIHYASTTGGYWNAVYEVWQAQYTGLEFYTDTFLALADDEGNAPSKARLMNDMDGDGVSDKDDGRWQVLEFMEKIITPTYVEASSNASKFTEAQIKFLNDEAVMMVNGSWLQNEMNNRDKNLLMMKTPVISAIANDKGGRCKSIADDTELQAVIRAVDAADSAEDVPLKVEGKSERENYDISPEDRNAVFEARNLMYANFDSHGILIPNYATAKEAAKDFVRFFYRDSSILTFMNNVHLMLPIGLDDESKMPDITTWSTWEQQQTTFFETAQPLMESSGRKSEVFTEGGAFPYANINFVSLFCSHGDRQGAKEVWDKMMLTFDENWSTYLINAGIGGEEA